MLIQEWVSQEYDNIAQMRLKIIGIHIFGADADEKYGTATQIALLLELLIVSQIVLLVFSFYEYPFTLFHLLEYRLFIFRFLLIFLDRATPFSTKSMQITIR